MWPERPYQTQLEYRCDERTGQPLYYREVTCPTGSYFPAKTETDVFRGAGLDPIDPDWEQLRGILVAERIPAEQIERLTIPAIVGILGRLYPQALINEEPVEVEAPESPKEARDQIRLPWKEVEGYLFDALLKAHDYDFDEGKVIRYDRQVDANRVVQEIQKEYLVDDEKAKQAVYDAFRRRFPAPAGWNTKPGKKTYDAMCKEQTPLLHWFLRQTGQDRSERVGEARTIGDMSDVQGRKLVR